MRQLILLPALLGTLVGIFGCEPDSGGEGVVVKPAPGVDPAVLEQKEFTVEPLFGSFAGESGQVLDVDSENSIVLRESSDPGSKVLFQGRWSLTFDGVRAEISKVNGEGSEADAYFRVVDGGYEFKDSLLLEKISVDKSFSRVESDGN